MAGAAERSQPETPPPAVEARDRRGRCRRPCKPRIGHRPDLPRRGRAPAATSTGERVVRPAGRRPRAAHSRRGAQATPARTVRWFQCVRPAATRWPHRLLRVPDTARVVHQDKWCRAPTRLEHCRTAAPATPPSGQQRAPDPRQHAPVRTAPVRPRHHQHLPSGRTTKPRHGIVSAHMVPPRRPDVTAHTCWPDTRATPAGEQIAHSHLARSDGNLQRPSASRPSSGRRIESERERS